MAQLVGCCVDVSPAHAGVHTDLQLMLSWGGGLVRAPGPTGKTLQDLAESSMSAAQCPRC